MKIVTSFKNQWFFIVLLVLILSLFFFLQPTFLTYFSPFHQENLWNNFVKDLSTKSRMDTKTFWQMREFYSPGSFTFRREGLPKEKQTELFEKLSLPTELQKDSLLFLNFNANKFSSFDSLVPAKNAIVFPQVISSLNKKYPTVARGENYIIVQKDATTAIIVFLANDKELKQANGFLDYREKDVKLVKDKLWFDLSEIKIK